MAMIYTCMLLVAVAWVPAVGSEGSHSELYRGPRFLSQPENSTFFVVIDGPGCVFNCPTVTFNCNATGDPQPTYQWYEKPNEFQLQWQGLPADTVNMVSTLDYITVANGSLTIHQPNRNRDLSSYWCEASNSFGSIRSELVTIDFTNGRWIYYKDYTTLNEFPKFGRDHHVRLFDAIGIPCDHARRIGERYTYRWFINSDPTSLIDDSENGTHIFASMSGVLYFSSVTAAESKSYHCQVSIEGMSISRISPPYVLNVETSLSVDATGPAIHHEFLKVIPRNPVRGDTVYLECFARFILSSAQDPVVYEWRRADGQPLPENSVMESNNRRLRITNVKTEDEGEYTCTVTIKQMSDSKSTILRIPAKPYFGEGRLNNLQLDQGSDYNWTCMAEGSPLPTYSWYVNSTLPEEGSASFSEDKRVLMISKADTATHPGMYQCVATNAYGTTYSSAQLIVLVSRAVHSGVNQVREEEILEEGSVVSHSAHPDPYPSGIDSTLTLTGLKLTATVNFIFTKMDFPSNCSDYLEIGGLRSSDIDINRVCNNSNELERWTKFQTTSTNISFHFVTANQDGGQGFRLNYQVDPNTGCPDIQIPNSRIEANLTDTTGKVFTVTCHEGLYFPNISRQSVQVSCENGDWTLLTECTDDEGGNSTSTQSCEDNYQLDKLVCEVESDESDTPMGGSMNTTECTVCDDQKDVNSGTTIGLSTAIEIIGVLLLVVL